MIKKKAIKVFILIFFLSACVFAQDIPSQVEFYLDQAAAFKEDFGYSRAIDFLSQSDFVDNPYILRELAKLLYLNGDSKEALEVSKGIVDKEADDYLYLGLFYEDLGYSDKAVKAYQNSLGVRQNSIALFRLAKIYRAKKDYRQAIFYLQRLIEHDSSQRLAYYYLGQCFQELGQAKDAYRFLSRAANFYPHIEEIRYKLQEARNTLGEDFFLKQRALREEKRERVVLTSYQEKVDIPLVRVGIGVGLDEFSFQSPTAFKIQGDGFSYHAKGSKFYTLRVESGELFLFDRNRSINLGSFANQAEIIPVAKDGKVYPFYVLDLVYGKGDFWHTVIDRAYRGRFEVIIKDKQINLINVISIEEYLYGVLAAEIPPNSGKEALQAQAVLARSLALRRMARHINEGFDFCADIHCQVYHGLFAETDSTQAAVDATRGRVITYQGEIPEIFYHSNCGGYLSPDVFGDKSYLASGADSKTESLPESAYKRQLWFVTYPQSFCSLRSANFRWQRIYDSEDFELITQANLEDLKKINLGPDSKGFRYSEMELKFADQSISLSSGLSIRNYFDRLRSSSFRVEFRKRGLSQSSLLIFWGAGFGHGSGLCQQGAIGMADAGYNYQEILKHYYPKVTIEKHY